MCNNMYICTVYMATGDCPVQDEVEPSSPNHLIILWKIVLVTQLCVVYAQLESTSFSGVYPNRVYTINIFLQLTRECPSR